MTQGCEQSDTPALVRPVLVRILRYFVLQAPFSNIMSSDQWMIFIAEKRPLTELFAHTLSEEEGNTCLWLPIFDVMRKVKRQSQNELSRNFSSFTIGCGCLMPYNATIVTSSANSDEECACLISKLLKSSAMSRHPTSSSVCRYQLIVKSETCRIFWGPCMILPGVQPNYIPALEP